MVEMQHMVIKISPADNVAIITNPAGLQKGVMVLNHIVLTEDIPMGHKVALKTLQVGDPVIRYGHTIGFARKIIEQGSWINEFTISLPQPPSLADLPYQKPDIVEPEPLKGYFGSLPYLVGIKF